MKALLILSVLLTSGSTLFSQENWLKFPSQAADSARAKHIELNYNGEPGKVTVYKDPRIDKLSEFVRTGEETLEGVKIDGFRIVIFFDQSKSDVERQKASFLSRYNEHRAYIDYVAPNYRVRVGNFRTRLEAEKFKEDLLGNFPTAVVVEDKIQLPVLPEAEPRP